MPVEMRENLDCRLRRSLEAKSSPPSRFGPAARFGCRNRIEKLPVLPHVAIGTEGDEVIEGVVAQLAPLDLVVDLQVLERPALLTAPFVPLQHPLHKPPVNLFSQLDSFYLL